MRLRQRIVLLSSLTALALAVGVTGVTVVVLYRTAFAQQREQLEHMAESQARLIDALAASGDTAAAADLVHEAHREFHGFGVTGEFVLGRREADQIVFLLEHDGGLLEPVPWVGTMAEPMRRALKGLAGTITGADYVGTSVLAAYEPIQGGELGIVAKIDVGELRAPFIRAGITAGGIAAALLLLSTVVLRFAISASFVTLQSVVQTTAASSAGLSQGIVRHERVVDGQMTAVGDTASAITELNATFTRAAELARQSAADAEQALGRIEEGQQVVQETVAAMSELGASSSELGNQVVALGESVDRIGEMSDLVENIARQTSILSLNAAVEAARAGEHGRGFAAISDEIRALSEQSESSARTIREQIELVQASTNTTVFGVEAGARTASSAVSLMDQAAEAFRDVAAPLRHAAESGRQTATSASQQLSAVGSVSGAMAVVSEGSEETHALIRKMRADLDDLTRISDDLKRLV
ncbi:hypothetical protein HN371_01310 [Candidatus Poribacteria bacterium]|jgi:hypothetical protein|nr:hypothetical protein [Candidatus Poribacteria bacterium]MBT5532908.1 hypothetical protein [Candidatus Poribacteria bacterium]MBT5713014.1 hypothetical protein [Candidatus Poribacteria bacterium]MBT7804231.1 hypothetical protein [Candidatus Poribacteria bacterium]